jgi:hypothetical protein
MKRNLFIACGIGLLAGCSSQPKLVNPGPYSVTYQYEGDQLQKVTDKAASYCSSVGRAAHLRNVAEVGGQNVAIYDCV